MTAHSYRETLRRLGLQPFLWTQFLGAFNDNPVSYTHLTLPTILRV